LKRGLNHPELNEALTSQKNDKWQFCQHGPV